MVGQYFNPFQKTDIRVPKSLHETFIRYCQHNEGFDQSPFPRMIDLWFLSVCIAIRLELEPSDITERDTVKIIDGTIFSSDPWRIHILRLIAIEKSGDMNIVLEPNKMITLANNLAIAGLPKIIEMLKSGGAEPIWNLSEALSELLKENRSNDT